MENEYKAVNLGNIPPINLEIKGRFLQKVIIAINKLEHQSRELEMDNQKYQIQIVYEGNYKRERKVEIRKLNGKTFLCER